MTYLASQYLEQTPMAAYMSFLPQLNKPARRYFSNQYNNIWNEYQGMLGQESQTTGQLPKLTFMDFLKNYPFMQKYGALTPQQTGSYPNLLKPPARLLNY